MKINTNNTTSFLLVILLILSTGLYLHRSNSYNKLSKSHIALQDDIVNFAEFYHDVNNTFYLENADVEYEISSLLLTNSNGEKNSIGELFANDTVVCVVIVDDCLSCLDKNLDVFDEFKEEIVFIAGFRTHRDFLTYNHPNIDTSKSFYANKTEIVRIFPGLENILVFRYCESSGILSKYVHTYRKSNLTKQYLQIFRGL